MTVLGAIVEPDRAVLWADSEVYRAGKPNGEACKLALNALGVACVGTGNLGLLREAAAVVYAATSIDDVEYRLPSKLRARAARIAPAVIRCDFGWFTGQGVIAVGHSPSAGRMIGWRFDAGSFLEAVLVSRACVPCDAGLEADISRLDATRHVVAIARRQLALLRLHGLPDVTGGSLTIAELTAGSTRTWCIPDFDVADVSSGAAVLNDRRAEGWNNVR